MLKTRTTPHAIPPPKLKGAALSQTPVANVRIQGVRFEAIDARPGW